MFELQSFPLQLHPPTLSKKTFPAAPAGNSEWCHCLIFFLTTLSTLVHFRFQPILGDLKKTNCSWSKSGYVSRWIHTLLSSGSLKLQWPSLSGLKSRVICHLLNTGVSCVFISHLDLVCVNHTCRCSHLKPEFGMLRVCSGLEGTPPPGMECILVQGQKMYRGLQVC